MPFEGTFTVGQSHAHNNSGDGNSSFVTTTRSPRSRRCWMLDNNGTPGEAFETDFSAAGAREFIGLRDGRGGLIADGYPSAEQNQLPIGQSLGALNWALDRGDIIDGRTPPERVYMTGVAEGGRQISALRQAAANFVGQNGTYSIFARGRRKLERAVAIARVYRPGMAVPLVVRTVPFLQGDADMLAGVGTSKATYKTQFAALQAEVDAMIKAATGQTEDPEWITYVTSSVPNGLGGPGIGGAVQQAQIEIATENASGRISCTGPDYYMSFFGAHRLKEWIVVHAEELARARRARLQGSRADICRVTSASISGNVITLTCSVPGGGALEIDTTSIPPMTGTNSAAQSFVQGFEYTDGAGRTISSVAVNGPQIAVTLSGAPGSSPRLRYAMNGLGYQLLSSLGQAADLAGRADASTTAAWGNVFGPRREAPVFAPASALMRDALCQFDLSF